MKEVPDQSQVQRVVAPIVVLEKGELIQQLLRRVLVLAVSCIDEGGFAVELVALGVGGTCVLKPAADPF
ncbi:hypothetical protein SDC9_51628 [bioreactor metagenome]|uniref:Uncharacterized protein n=1 Tax=bioreactor metagenome TaxID=1076179 RepID=A0A644WNE8_9ZZZZ